MTTTGLMSVPTEKVIEWRRKMHANPELSYKEFETANWVAGLLEEMGVTAHRPTPTSVVGELVGTKAGEDKCVALRADMDALPLPEETGEEFTSQVPGVMHACGHDAHTSMLLGAAQVLAERRDEFAGRVKFIFQHAEEVPPGGAQEIIKTGILDDVQGVFGIHVLNDVLNRMVMCKGPASTIAGGFYVTIYGTGSHGSMPHKGVDPVLVVSQCVVALNTIVSRSINPFQMAVVNPGTLETSSKAPNAIPDWAKLGVSMRATTDEDWEILTRRATEVIEGVCASYGARAEFDWILSYPVVNNDPEMTELAQAAVAKANGEEFSVFGPGTTASEDFSYYTQKIPGCFMFLGAGNQDNGLLYMNHHPKFNIVEECLDYGVRANVQVALDFLNA